MRDGLLTSSAFLVNPLPALVEEYFGRFSTKACCFDDLKPYLEALSDEERQQFLAKTLEIADAATELVRPSFLSERVRLSHHF